MEDKLLRYEELSLVMKKFEAEKKALGAEILQEMIVQNSTKSPQLKAGYIILKSRKGYEYSADVDNLEAEIKKTKKLEELNGIAQLKETQYLQYENR